MATKEEKQQLIDTLKFTPRTYKVSMWGYGGEKVMGRVDPAVWDYCMENSVDLVEIAWGDEDTVEEMGLDVEKLPFGPGCWYDCDGIAHVNGVSRSAGTLQIEDENGNTVVEESLETFDGGDGSPALCGNDESNLWGYKKGDVVFIGSSNEKGTFFEGEIELRAPFDIEKLELHFDEVDGEEIVNGLYYDGEEIENWGGSTDGKSSDMVMVRFINDDNDWESYDPEEKDWGHPDCGPSPDDWEKSAEFKFAEHQPQHPGYYRCHWSYFGTSYGTLYWNGTEFGEWEHGKFKPQQGEMKTWQGYNWDTATWDNRPPEPPEVRCKTCGWTGTRDQMTMHDVSYDYECGSCKSTKLDWIEYDPETKKGLANRKKYCVPAMPVADTADLEAALQELKADYERLMEQEKV